MVHRFIKHVGLQLEEQSPGHSRCVIEIEPHHLNSFGVVHGGVLFTLADTAMGAALLPLLRPGETCATIEAKINYFKPAQSGRLVCTSDVVHQGRSVANIEAQVFAADVLIAKANGSFSILRRE